MTPSIYGRQMKSHDWHSYQGWILKFGPTTIGIHPSIAGKDFTVFVDVNDVGVYTNYRPTIEAACKTLEVQLRKMASGLRRVNQLAVIK